MTNTCGGLPSHPITAHWLAVVSALLCAAALCTGSARASNVLMLADRFPGSSDDFCNKLKNSVSGAGFALREVDGASLAGELSEEAGRGSVLLLPDARWLPADAKAPLVEFLKRGNHLLAISGPAFENLVVRAGGEWKTNAQLRGRLALAPGESIVDFAAEDLSAWRRMSGTMTNKTEFRVEPSGDATVPTALRVDISRLDDWEVIAGRGLDKPFPQGFTVTAFWAKGGPNTPELVVEWREKDGSRWMAVVKISGEWKRHALTPDDFRFWGDGSPTGRGGKDDRFNPANAEAVCFELASGLSAQKLGIAHSFWVAGVTAVRDEFADVDFSAPVLESISPPYKTYRADAAKVEGDGPSPLTEVDVVSPIPRGKGFGCDAVRKSRFIPVVTVTDPEDEPRGTSAHLYLNTANDFAGSVWGFVGYDQSILEKHADQALPVILSMLDRIRTGVFLANAGSEFFAYTQGERAILGAYVANLRSEPVKARLTVSIEPGDDSHRAFGLEVVVPPVRDGDIGKQMERLIQIERSGLKPGEYVAGATLEFDGKRIDRISHPFRVVGYPRLTDRNTVTAEGGRFRLAGKLWHALGVNYWPRYATALELADFSAHWLSPEQYDPDIIEQDLTLAQKLGMNLVSIQYTRQRQARPLMDFLARCEAHGIKAHIYLPGLHPLAQDFTTANELIRLAHLARNPAVFAYDLGWEVHVGRYDARRAYDKLWQQWVVDRYGSLDSAEADWKFKPERIEGVIAGPKDEQLLRDGEHRVFVAAYRRFWDDEISKRYRQVRENVRRLDRRHLLGARSGYGGTGSMWAVPNMPFDLASGARHLDFISPEGYGLRGDRLGFLSGGLTTLYGQFVSGGKPIYWAEYGTSIWPNCGAQELEGQRQYYENMLNMTRVSASSGSAAWWWPGGLRRGEESDYGIVNPDGSPRPAALEFPKLATILKTRQHIRKTDCAISIDRDKHVAGYAGIFAEHADDYVRAVEAGKRPKLMTRATGKTSADVPLVAVGNVPYSGHNPPKYLNAELDWVRINGRRARSGDTIGIPRGEPVYIEVSVGNMAEATWVATKNAKTAGAVGMVVLFADSGKVAARVPIPADAPFLASVTLPRTRIVEAIDAETQMSLRMEAEGRARFGEVFRLTLRPI